MSFTKMGSFLDDFTGLKCFEMQGGKIFCWVGQGVWLRIFWVDREKILISGQGTFEPRADQCALQWS